MKRRFTRKYNNKFKRKTIKSIKTIKRSLRIKRKRTRRYKGGVTTIKKTYLPANTQSTRQASSSSSSSLKNIDYSLFAEPEKEKEQMPDNTNYYKVPTLMNGDCFYSAYYRLARAFNNDKNLTIFPECANNAFNEDKWIRCFKQGLCTRMMFLEENDDKDLKKAVDDFFNGVFIITLNEYLDEYNKKQSDYLFEQYLRSSKDYDIRLDGLWVHAFTRDLPRYLDGNPPFLLPLLRQLKKIDKSSAAAAYTDTIMKFSNTNRNFQKIKNIIKKKFIEGLNMKNCGNDTHAYATEAEISIIKNYINLKHAKDNAIIRIKETILQSNMQPTIIKPLLEADENKIQFIFYKTDKHYEGLYSQLALDRHMAEELNIKEERGETFGFNDSQ